VRDPDPVIFLEHKSLYATKGEVPDGEIVDKLGTAKILRPGKDATIICAGADGAARARRPPRSSRPNTASTAR
jgi:pyruvate dehydrogenase E1 component beta subunit